MDCFIAKLTGNAGFETKVRFYSASARSYLETHQENKRTFWRNDMYEILADACDRQKHYAEREGITASHIGNTQKDINRFLEEALQEERYHIKEFAPCPEKKTR